jgi:hypothetical protein
MILSAESGEQWKEWLWLSQGTNYPCSTSLQLAVVIFRCVYKNEGPLLVPSCFSTHK